MPLATDAPTNPTRSTPQRRRFSLAEYDRLTDIGFWQDNDRIELIEGELIQMAAKGTAHVLCCRQTLEQLIVLLHGTAIVQGQDPIVIPSGSEPEPDIVIANLSARGQKPQADQIWLIIEVADSSLDYDRDIKGPLYAKANIPYYWIFNCLDRQVECHSQPRQNAQGQWLYGLRQVVFLDQILTLPPPMEGTIAVNDCF
jgi:Uma2 family endonuclease